MSKEKRYLIVNADEKTWKFDRPVVFLGEWCRLYDRKSIWEPMNAVVAKPYGLGLVQKDKDFAEARNLEDKIFPLLCSSLNNYHKTDHGERFWKITLGHWFRRYIDTSLNRFKTLERCIDLYDISGMSIYKNHENCLAPLDSYSAIWAFNDDRWNNALIFQMLVFLGLANFPIEFVEENTHSQSYFNYSKKPQIKKILEWGSIQASKFLGLFVKNTDALIINSYLPFAEEIRLCLSLKQSPQFYSSSEFKVVKKSNPLLRQELTKKNNSNKNLENLLIAMMFHTLPVCYLEGFDDLKKIADKQSWPKKPKFIFTSNNFDTDEIFKFWTANKVECGYKYIVGQHGNNYGTYRYMYPSLEEITADKFLTWGWKDGLKQHAPAFILKRSGIKNKLYDSKGQLLLIELCQLHRITTWDNYAEFGIYFEEQQKFVFNLTDELKRNLIIRLHPDYKNHKWQELDRWRLFDPKLNIETGNIHINKLIAKSRIIIHSYDSTGILETLSQNIPTLAFWQNGFDHLRESAKPYYQVLLDVGIIHFSSISVAKKVNQIWENIDEWWFSQSVQEARRVFCNNYARTSKNPIYELNFLLN